jgi:hypothetical protein
MHTSLNAKLEASLQRMYQFHYHEFVPTATGASLDEMLTRSYGQGRLPGESDNDYRDRLTKPVTERYEIHEVIGYDA